MHRMLKLTLLSLVAATIFGGVALSNMFPAFNHTLYGICLLFSVLIMFFAIAYALRGVDPKA